MKVRRTIGGALFGIGCAVTFVGILATVLPMVQNDQLQLVLSSFEMPSGNLIVRAVNGAMTYALHHCYGVLLCGIAMMAVGMGILLRRSRRRPARRRASSPYSRPASAPASKPVWPEEDADWSAWKPREARTNPFAGAIYEDLPPRTPSPAVPTAYTPPPILPPSNAEDEPSPYARPFAEPPAPPPVAEPADAEPFFATPSVGERSSTPESSAPPAVEPPSVAQAVQEPTAASTSFAVSGMDTAPSVPVPPAPSAVPAHTEAGTPSQSGSRVMIRSTIAARAEKSAPEPTAPAPPASRKVVLDGIAYEPNEPPEEEVAPPVSSRIRSTMGKHTV